MHRAASRCEPGEKMEEGKKIVAKLGELKYELQHDRKMTLVYPLGRCDRTIADWKQTARGGWWKGYRGIQQGARAERLPILVKHRVALLRVLSLQVQWPLFPCPPLRNIANSIPHRRVATIFALSKHWKSHDVFSLQKLSTFRSSRPAVLELAHRYRQIMSEIRNKDVTPSDDASRLLFTEMCEICLWGNATDLSLLTTLTYADIQKLQGSEARKASEKNILVNDLPRAYDILATAKAEGKKYRQVDIVLDNAGFELYVDLILAGYLLATGLATNIILHPKNIPWFVSDVLPADFAALLNALNNPKAFFESPSEDEERNDVKPAKLSAQEEDDLKFLFSEWSNFHAEGEIYMRSNQFWTEGGSFWRLPSSASRLYDDLKESELVIFKGDLNYRKLVADGNWDPTTPFQEAIGPLGKDSGVNVLSLRTCKADVVVGLPEGRDEELRGQQDDKGESGARKWAWSGKWAVVSLSEGKK